MAERMNGSTFREVNIYLNQLQGSLLDLRKDIEENRVEQVADLTRVETTLSAQIREIKDELQKERREREANRIQRNFLIVSAFVAPIIVSFFVNAAGFGK